MSEINILTAQNVSIKFKPASVGDRILAAVLDGIFVFVYIMVVYGIFMFLVLNESGRVSGRSDAGLYIFFAALTPILFYHLLCEYFFNGQSIGKKILKLRVIKLDGTPPGIGSYLLRWLLRLVDIQLFSGLVAVVAIAVSDKSQRLGDMAAGTTVIKEQEFVPLEYLRPSAEAHDHQVTFPEVEKLSDKDIHTLKLVVQRWEQTGDEEKVEQAAARVKQILGVRDYKGFSALEFIQTVIADFSFLSHF